MLFALALAAVSTAVPARAGEAQLGAWRDYALRGITPEYQWANRPAAESVRPSVIDTLQPARTMRMPELKFDAAPATEGGISLGVSRALRQRHAVSPRAAGWSWPKSTMAVPASSAR